MARSRNWRKTKWLRVGLKYVGYYTVWDLNEHWHSASIHYFKISYCINFLILFQCKSRVSLFYSACPCPASLLSSPLLSSPLLSSPLLSSVLFCYDVKHLYCFLVPDSIDPKYRCSSGWPWFELRGAVSPTARSKGLSSNEKAREDARTHALFVC